MNFLKADAQVNIKSGSVSNLFLKAWIEPGRAVLLRDTKNLNFAD